MIAATALLLLAGCGGSNFRPEQAGAVSTPAQLPTPSTDDTLAASRDYKLGPADKISVKVFGVADLDTEGQVDANGNFVMPLAGTIAAAGQSPEQLAKTIEAKLGDKYIRNPEVTVAVVEALSQRITIDGAVKTPGRYPLVGRTTVTEAVALGQGLADGARTSEVVIFRTVNGQRFAARFNLDDIRGGRAPDPEVYGNDIVVVGQDKARQRFKDLISVAPLLSLFYLIR
jgi:polysaccharide export outer membrane protein